MPSAVCLSTRAIAEPPSELVDRCHTPPSQNRPLQIHSPPDCRDCSSVSHAGLVSYTNTLTTAPSSLWIDNPTVRTSLLGHAQQFCTFFLDSRVDYRIVSSGHKRIVVSPAPAAGDRPGCRCRQAEQGQGATGAADGGGRGVWENGKEMRQGGKQGTCHEEISQEPVVIPVPRLKRALKGTVETSVHRHARHHLHPCLCFDVYSVPHMESESQVVLSTVSGLKRSETARNGSPRHTRYRAVQRDLSGEHPCWAVLGQNRCCAPFSSTDRQSAA